MSLNKTSLALILFSLGIFYISCGDSEEKKQQAPALDMSNAAVVLSEARKVLGENTKIAFTGSFDEDPEQDVVAGTETSTPEEWGIRFFLLKKKNNTLAKDFQTELLEGSFRECLVNKIKFPSYPGKELIYYNSMDYYMGSGGGEVFSYIIDLERKEILYSHLIAEPEKPVLLYLSDNISSPEIRNFFIGNFKRDYPGLTVVSNDVKLEN